MSIAGDQSFAQNINATIPTIGAGILFNHATFYVGFSTPNLIGNSLASRDDFELSLISGILVTVSTTTVFKILL